jgi:hypothetical protein
MLITPNMSPPDEYMVKSDPSRLPLTGAILATTSSLSHTRWGLPSTPSGLAYTRNMKMHRAIMMITVCRYDATNVAFRPPARVYTTTPGGMSKQATSVFMPVSAVTTAEPPSSSIVVTRMLVVKAKNMNTR